MCVCLVGFPACFSERVVFALRVFEVCVSRAVGDLLHFSLLRQTRRLFAQSRVAIKERAPGCQLPEQLQPDRTSQLIIH